MSVDVLGEFIGTAMLVLLGDGVEANVSLNKSKGQDAGWLTIAIGWGLAVAVAAYVSGFMGPAHLNPAVSLAFVLTGDLSWGQLGAYTLAQMAGAFLGAVLVWLHYRPHFEATPDAGTILGVYATGPAIRSTVDNLISEIIGSFILTFGIMTFGLTEMAPGLATSVVGALIIAIGVSLGGPTGYAINPARDLGPRLAHAILPMQHKGSSDWAYAWIPIIGPCLGAMLAAWAYLIVK
ncbi:aquaporin [Aerococcus urinaehominis]|uniref:Aquaporin n=1 Tax=Aerococcus urinaehominis TaxID=128944 RepID=A0A0X8FKB6_9LACT|nr:MIP/aquaporin family protein [Aerococcus urinaehominis]AMB98879.1 aquaporin [Aerococcus urinaehominis]SDM16213.1 glycerol uptake facilitator protein [Aerococcus urinaehominis]